MGEIFQCLGRNSFRGLRGLHSLLDPWTPTLSDLLPDGLEERVVSILRFKWRCFIPPPTTIFFWKTYKTLTISLSLMSSGFMHVVVWVRISFLILHCVSRPHWFNHSFFDWLHLGGVHLLWIILLWMRVYKYPFKSLLLLLLSIYPKVKSLDYIATLCLIFWGTTNIVFHNDCTVSYSTNVAGFQLPYIFTNTCYSLLVFLEKIATLVSMNHFRFVMNCIFRKLLYSCLNCLLTLSSLFLTYVLTKTKFSSILWYYFRHLWICPVVLSLWNEKFKSFTVSCCLCFFHLLVILTLIWPWRIFLRSVQAEKNTCNVKVENSFYSLHFLKT